MISLFSGDSANDVWKQAHLALQDTNSYHLKQSRNGSTREILHALFSISNPRQRWILSRRPAINPAFAIAEIVWILAGRNDASFLTYWNSKLPEYVGSEPLLHGAYGYRLRNGLGIDQLERAYEVLHVNSTSRQVVLQIWNGAIDLPYANGSPQNQDIPCNVMALLKVHNGTLEWTQINRSNDLFLGVPYNFIQFTTLQEVLAGWLGLNIGSYNHLSDSLHYYIDKTELIGVDNKDESIENIDSIALEKEASRSAFLELEANLDSLSSAQLSEINTIEMVEQSKLPQAFRNYLLVLASEYARKRNWSNAATEMVENISNPALKVATVNWQRSFQKRAYI